MHPAGVVGSESLPVRALLGEGWCWGYARRGGAQHAARNGRLEARARARAACLRPRAPRSGRAGAVHIGRPPPPVPCREGLAPRVSAAKAAVGRARRAAQHGSPFGVSLFAGAAGCSERRTRPSRFCVIIALMCPSNSSSGRAPLSKEIVLPETQVRLKVGGSSWSFDLCGFLLAAPSAWRPHAAGPSASPM